MNRGEGVKIAAKNKSSKLGIYMFQEPKKKTKKFGYKARSQQFPIRKDGQTIDETPLQQLSKTTRSKPQDKQSSKAAQPKPFSKPQAGSIAHSNRQNAHQNGVGKAGSQKEKARTDIINKNKRIQSKNEKTGNRADTVTLTQDQLNAILQTIGSSGSSAGATSFAIDGGKLKVNLAEAQHENDRDTEEEAYLAEQQSANDSRQRSQGEQDRDRVDKNHTGDANNNNTDSSLQKKQDHGGHGIQENTVSPRGGGQVNFAGTASIGGPDNRTLLEKKRQQWKQELDAQVAEKKSLQEKERGNRGRGPVPGSSETWNPWGQPGCGAPPKNFRGGENFTPRQNQLDAIQTSPGRSRGQGSSDMLSQSISGLGSLERQQKVPAAMRSSFIIGGSAGRRTDEHLTDVKWKEKEEWLRDLEKQKREAKERRDHEKAHQRDRDSVMQHWAEPVDPSLHRPARMDSRVAQVQDDISVRNKMETEKREQNEQPKSAPLPSARLPHSDEDDDNRHIRPANTLVDPAEMERRDMQRKKHLEHMAAVKAQVEEKQRKKREADERRRQDEAEEERRLREERDQLAMDFEKEQAKQRKKEETAAAKQRALEESMQHAQQEAAKAKHQERVRKLQKQGHDVTNLRMSWDDHQHVPEVSSRLPNQSIGTHHQPPQAATSLIFSPRVEQAPPTHAPPPVTTTHQYAASVPPAIQDAATSPINDVSTQTDIDVLNTDYISPRLIEAIRLASGEAEFKPKGSKRTDHEKKKQPQEGGRKKDGKATKASSVKEDRSEGNHGANRRGSNAEKPKWGQPAGNKKKLKNSEKDMSMSKKKREERLKKRQEELLALQEKSAPKRAAPSRQTRTENRPAETESKGRKSRVDSRQVNHAVEMESRVPAALRDKVVRSKQDDPAPRRDVRATSSEDSFQTLPETPPLTQGDFIPFMRTDDEELEAASQSLTPSPALSSEKQAQVQQISEKEATTREEPATRQRQSRQSHREMDPLLNPERLKDKEHRQEQILIQLSNLRQGLLMKQREMEIGFSPSPII